MADPINFYGANVIFKPPADMADCRDLPVHQGPNEVISCWRLTPEEIACVAETGEVWLSVAGESVPPMHVSGLPKMYCQSPVSGLPLKYRTDGLHIVSEAMDYAVLRHGDQPYGPYTHSYHLGKVVTILDEFGYGWVYLASGWLHDTIEDTEVEPTFEERKFAIDHAFGDTVGNLVWAVTGVKVIDGVRQNRKACNEQIYMKIEQLPEAAPLKGADRIANMEYTLESADEDKASMYCKEFPEFMRRVGSKCPEAMVARLNAVFDHLVEMFPKLSKYKDNQ